MSDDKKAKKEKQSKKKKDSFKVGNEKIKSKKTETLSEERRSDFCNQENFHSCEKVSKKFREENSAKIRIFRKSHFFQKAIWKGGRELGQILPSSLAAEKVVSVYAMTLWSKIEKNRE